MPCFRSCLSLWAQAACPPEPARRLAERRRLALSSSASRSRSTDPDRRCSGGLLTLAKVVSLFCLLGWVAWAVDRVEGADGRPGRLARPRRPGRGSSAASPRCCSASSVDPAGSPIYKIGGLYAVDVLARRLVALVLFVWVERALWATIGRLGAADRPARARSGCTSRWSLGLVIGFLIRSSANAMVETSTAPTVSIAERPGARASGSARRSWASSSWPAGRACSCSARSPRSGPGGSTRSPSSASIESNRRMWAPWVVLTVFVVILAFTHWFLQPPERAGRDRPALRRHADAALLAADHGHGRAPRAAQPAAGHPEPDDLHGRLEAGPAARAGLGPDDRVHGARDGPDRGLRRDQPALPRAGTSAGRSTTTEAGRPSASQDRTRPRPSSSASRPTSSGPGCRPACRSRAR